MVERLCIKEFTHEYLCYIYLNGGQVVAVMKFISTIVLSLLSVTVSAVVIDSPSASESESSKQSDDDIFGNTLCDDAFPLPKSYVPENERYIPTPQQRLSRVEGYLKLENMEIPESVGDGYPHKMSAKTKERILEVKRRIRGRKMSSSDKKKFERFAAGRLWVCRRFALGSS
ncbi:hypothetical protein BDEG_28295 [Batrachochytrium dendrobatidis JEL423]|uniref:Uncharacterized protein n=1 Tax=Batrachochytrium dendrobatidis (strain JEL423) TaxID=403673 RepID=A0A177WZL8_BATDL|nr:hypothetical protein BDEG_28295 [Batrachochytrium dendrobatidis JEL423]